uniref:Piccolo presynaptic cytomatrix protein a n=1 Tax=Hippocampus comes TaxID=109280 RepID=A0A3Q2XH00_HIPCM
MSENEDASPSDEENHIRREIRQNERRRVEEKKTGPVASGKAKRLSKKNSLSLNDEEDNAPLIKVDLPELKEEDPQSGVAVRKFQTIELNTTSSPLVVTQVNIEPEMECLTDSPDDRSKGEGSSSLHASSFTPGTSPTSLSSLDEDSDSSSPGHVRSSESKQHRKAKHRQAGQMLPTIEDSSEEDELREEEELLKEQEKQRGAGKKSKRDKEEVRGQRRRDRSMTPPSNLSPIEDASPTEELRQEAEMEEIRRSSCSDFSPSIDSDPEGFEIHAAKIAAVQKTYQLPISVSHHSPTENKNTDKSQRKALRSAEEAYEEIILRAKSPTVENVDFHPEKEALYGGMLIEDYAYASVTDNSTDDLGATEKISVPAQPKKLRSPDEVYEDMIKKRKEFMKLEQEYQNMKQPKNESTNPEIVLQPAETTLSKVTTVTLGKDGKPLLDAESAYEELMKKVLTPGESPTLQDPEVETTSSRRALYPIPDLKVTQCSSGELSSDEESIIKKEEETAKSTSAVETPSSASDQQPHTPVTASRTDTSDLSTVITEDDSKPVDLTGKGSGGTPTGTQKKVKRTLPNPPSEDDSSASGQTGYSTGSARRRMCRNSNMARAKILQDIDRELDLVERESSKLRKRQAELDEEEKEIDAKLRYLEMGINRRKGALLKEREKRERAYLQGVAEDRDYMSDSEVSNIRETRGDHDDGEDEEIESHGLERPRTAPQAELDDFVPPQTKHEYGKYSQYPYPQSQYQQSLYQTPQSYQSHSVYSSVPSLTSSQQQSYQQMLLLQQKAARQAALLSELDATKYDVISRQPDPTSSPYLGVKYDKYGNHLDLRALDVGSLAGSPMSAVSDAYYSDIDHHTPRSYLLLEDAAELAKSSPGLSSSYSLAERELAKAEKLLQRSAADLGSTDYLGSTSRLHTYGKTPDEEDPMEEPYELKLLKQQLKQEFRRSTGGTESLDPLTGLSQHYYTPSSSISSYSQRHYPKSDKYSISRLTLEKQAAKQLPASMLYQKHKTPLLEPKISSKYSSITESRALDMDYTSYLGSAGGSPRSSRLMQDEITFGLRKNIAEQQKYLGSTLGANLAGSLNLGQSLGLDSAYPSGSRSRPSSRPTSCYGLDLSIKRDPSSSSLRLKGDGEASTDSFQTPSGRAKPTSLPIVQSGRGRIPIVAQNSEEESPLSPVGEPMGMARASAGPLPPISADSRDQFGSCLSLQDSQQQQQQHIREEPSRGRAFVLMDDLQGTMSDSEGNKQNRGEIIFPFSKHLFFQACKIGQLLFLYVGLLCSRHRTIL